MNQNFWENIQNVDRRWLYLILIVVVTAGLFINVEVPAEADESSKAFYVAVQDLNPERPVLLQSDWTNSTRGENAGHMEAILRILIHRKQKFVVYSLADPQAPQVARNVIRTLNKTLPDDQKLVEGRDYLDLGFFPNAEGTTQAMATNLRKIWGGRTTRTPDGGNVPIFETDVLRNVNRIEDVAAVIYVTASNTIDIGIQRLSGRVTLLCMCTGVVGPTLLPYWSAGQLSGIAIGLKGVYDNEMMMAYGVNVRPPDGGNPRVTYTKLEGEIPPIPGYVHAGRGKTYYAALNLALTLMVLAVIVGNIAMFLAERQRKASGGRA